MPQSLNTRVFKGDTRVFSGFGDSAQGLTQWASLKRGLFELHPHFFGSEVHQICRTFIPVFRLKDLETDL